MPPKDTSQSITASLNEAETYSDGVVSVRRNLHNAGGSLQHERRLQMSPTGREELDRVVGGFVKGRAQAAVRLSLTTGRRLTVQGCSVMIDCMRRGAMGNVSTELLDKPKR